MNDQNDDAQNYALMVLAGVVALVIAGVIALAAATSMAGAGTPAAPAARAEAGDVPARIYFELGSADLPAGASEQLVKIADAAREQAGKVVLISGFHDASGDAAQNAELAKNRALAVRHALEANGVAPERLMLAKPALTTGGADAREARRVELQLR